MYLTITPQKLTQNYSQSSSDFVNYLEKENRTINTSSRESFFNQDKEMIPAEEVVQAIDGNTAKLKRSEPKYYSITINPSQRELAHIGNDKFKLRHYTREVMKNYAAAFHREIHGRSVRAEDILYFAKIESIRTFKGTDREVKENTPFVKRIAALENTIRQVDRGELSGNPAHLKKELHSVINNAPHKLNGKLVEQGVRKPGRQTHIHIIVSRKDISNSFSLSPGSKYRSSEVIMHGKLVKRGFERDQFFQNAEKTFDHLFSYKRNYVESYNAKKIFVRDPKSFYSDLQRLSPAEKKIAFAILNQSGLRIPQLNFAPSQISFALKQLKKALEIGIRSSSIGY